jgi:DNA polymerase-3 subunit epsilon
MRQVVIDTETTGLSTLQGHRIIEVACIEVVNRRLTGREFHRFLNPERSIDEGAERIHGISLAELKHQPRFADIVEDLLGFLAGAELVIHNAEFDVGFLEHELGLMRHPRPRLDMHCRILDTLSLARRLHPGQRNSLDALCKRYEIDASKRDVHGALIDAGLLARVYLAMTGGQVTLVLDSEQSGENMLNVGPGRETAGLRPDIGVPGPSLPVIAASPAESAAHENMLVKLRKSGACLWDWLTEPA